MLTDEQLRRICVKPDLPQTDLKTLPQTYQWASVLRGGRKYMAVAARVMNLEFPAGAIFTGPEGNGRHTTAYALAKTLCADRDGYQSLLSIHGGDLDFEDREDIYAVVGQISKIAKMSTALILILDQPGLCKHNSILQRTLLRLQKTMLAESLKLYLIVIADSAEDLCAELLSTFPRYHCPCPDQKAVKKWVRNMLNEPVPITIEGVTADDIAAAAEGLSWKQLKNLHQNLLRLTVFQYAVNKRKFDAQGLTEEQVYLEGKVKLPKAEVQKILNSTTAQKYAMAPLVSMAAQYSGQAMQIQSDSAVPDGFDPTTVINEEDVPEISISEFTQWHKRKKQRNVEDSDE